METRGCIHTGWDYVGRVDNPVIVPAHAYTEVAEGYGHKHSADGSGNYAAANFGIAEVCADHR